MKTIFSIILAGILSASSSFAQEKPVTATGAEKLTAVGSVSPLPGELSGRWHSPDNKYSQGWSMKKIDLAGKSAQLTWWAATRQGCGETDAPAVVEYDGSTLRVSIKKHGCINNLVAQLKKDTLGGFTGEAYMDSFGKLYDKVVVVLK